MYTVMYGITLKILWKKGFMARLDNIKDSNEKSF